MTANLIHLAQRRPARVPLVVALPLCEAQPVAVCTCGGLLDYQAGTWCHVEACMECWPPAAGPCPGRFLHAVCPDPEPVTCAHGTCLSIAEIELPCANDGAPGNCCGCCWELADLRDGRSLWPR
jgi:hypothetical protein